jgi:hypothetical protein
VARLRNPLATRGRWGGESDHAWQTTGKDAVARDHRCGFRGALVRRRRRASGDFGSDRDRRLANAADDLFGVGKPVAASSTQSIDAATANADPTKLITLARGLKARVVTTTSGANTDTMAFWPHDSKPTHLITCNEQGPADPGVQRINLATGAVETIVTGTTTSGTACATASTTTC